MTSDKQLKLWYAKFNRLYFNGELPTDTILYWNPGNDAAAITCPVFEVADGKFEITIDPMYSGMVKWWKVLLLHEMIHVRLWPKHPKHNHGKLFEDEKARIFALGAYKKLL